VFGKSAFGKNLFGKTHSTILLMMGERNDYFWRILAIFMVQVMSVLQMEVGLQWEFWNFIYAFFPCQMIGFYLFRVSLEFKMDFLLLRWISICADKSVTNGHSRLNCILVITLFFLYWHDDSFFRWLSALTCMLPACQISWSMGHAQIRLMSNFWGCFWTLWSRLCKMLAFKKYRKIEIN